MKRRAMIMAAVCVSVAAGAAQPPEPKPPEQPAPAKPTPPPPPKDPSPAAVPSLDEALGLSKPGDKPAPPPTSPDGKPTLPSDLDKALNTDKPEPADELQRAVALMEQSAGRLQKGSDTSLETQRMQEETVRLLDALIKKSGQKKNSNSKNQQKPQGQQQPDQKQQPNQSQQSQEQQRPQATTDPTDSPERGGTRNAQLRPGIDAARAAWGNLPQRVRQLLMQGSGDSFSKEYQRLTEEYYKRLGEQGN